jgi:hypothetical protein
MGYDARLVVNVEKKDVIEAQLRRLVLALFCFGTIGTGTELIALGHYEDQWQLAPLFVLSLALTAAVLQASTGNPLALRLLRAVALVMLLTGLAGVFLHYRGNLEFQLETYPDLSGWELFKKIVHAKAPPALAPGVVAQLGLLGLIYCFRHPQSRRAT